MLLRMAAQRGLPRHLRQQGRQVKGASLPKCVECCLITPLLLSPPRGCHMLKCYKAGDYDPHLVHPDLRTKVQLKQGVQKRHDDKQRSERSFQRGYTVHIRNISQRPKWILGFITKVIDPVSYRVMLGDGSIVHTHVDQVLARAKVRDIIAAKVTEPPVGPTPPAETMTCCGNPAAAGNGCMLEEHLEHNMKAAVTNVPAQGTAKELPPTTT